MKEQTSLAVDEFDRPGQAIQNTEWVRDPADPTKHICGLIQKGETVWFHNEQFGSGPAWQLVRLADGEHVYVHPHDFDYKQ
ncbi:hypothetical protein WBJ53_25045 [Spirosoma sp. SC4-14]|uniref:hypothetical protein n=1 Tax=Spirosoma sp. SC4-14 TaxID=3128900 RepID=UPI0030D59832